MCAENLYKGKEKYRDYRMMSPIKYLNNCKKNCYLVNIAGLLFLMAVFADHFIYRLVFDVDK